MKHLDRSQIYWIELSCCPEPVGCSAVQRGYSGKEGEANRVGKCWANGEQSRDKQRPWFAFFLKKTPHLPRMLVLYRGTFTIIWVLCKPVVHVCALPKVYTLPQTLAMLPNRHIRLRMHFIYKHTHLVFILGRLLNAHQCDLLCVQRRDCVLYGP